MRAPHRIASTLIALGAVFPLGLPGASAAELGEPAAAGAYYSSTTPPKDDALPTDPGNQFNSLNADRVAPGNLAVAVAVPERSDKESFLRFDLLSVPHGAVIDAAVVSVPLQPDDADNRSISPEPAKVKVCAAGPEGFADVDAGAYDEKPSVDCDRLEAVAEPSADEKAYTFDVTTLAKTWLTEINDGIALVPASLSTPFQVVFQPALSATINVSYTVKTETTPTVAPTPAPPPVVPPDIAPPVDTGTAVDPGFNTGGNIPLPSTGVQPTPRAPAPEVPVTSTRALTPVSDVTSPPTTFWLAALAGVVLLGVTSLILGDQRVAVSTGSRRNGVGKVLDERRAVAPRVSISQPARTL